MYAMYLRKSRMDADAEKSGEGNTLLRHKTTLLALAKHQNRQIGEIYEEVKSGETIAARPQMQRLLTDVEQGKWDGIFVMEIERLARGDSIDQGIVAQAFRAHNTLIITPTKTYDPSNEFDEEYFEFGLFMSRREYKSIRRRMEAGKYAAIREGKYMGKTAPFGYRRVRVQNGKGWTLEIIPKEAEIVRYIYHLHTKQAYGFQQIAHLLNKEGVLTHRGNAWCAYSIRTILDNITYAGYVYYGRRKTIKTSKGQKNIKRPPMDDEILICKGIHPPIISEQMFYDSQNQRAIHPNPRIRNDGDMINPLQGILFCRQCGHKLQLTARSNDKQSSLHCRTIHCSNVSARFYVVENALIQMLEQWLAGYQIQSETGYADSLKQQIHHAQQAKQHNQLLLHQQDKQRSMVYDLLETGVYTPDEFTQRRDSIQQQMQTLQQQIQQCELEICRNTQILEQQSCMVPRIKNLMTLYYDTYNKKEKNNLLKDIVYKVEYEKSTPYDDSSIQLWIYPRLKQKQ